MQSDLHLILILIGGVVFLALLLDLIRRNQKRKALIHPTWDDNVETNSFSDTTHEEINSQSIPSKDYSPKHVEPILGDPTLASLGFGDEVDFRPTVSREQRYPKKPIYKPTPSKPTVTSQPQPKSNNTVVLVVNVMAPKDKVFFGYELLQTLLAADMRFGEMNIFHRYQKINDQNEIVFSLASATKPGVFDLSSMGGFTCPGVSLFMKVKDAQARSHFAAMLETAYQLADELGADLYDEKHQLFTDETLAHYQEKLKYES